MAALASAAQARHTLRAPSLARGALQRPASLPKTQLLHRGSGLRAAQQHAHHRRRAPAVTAAAAAAPAAAAAAALSPAVVFDAATLLVLPFYVLIVAAPRARLTRRMLSGQALFVVAAALYALLLVLWQPLPVLADVAAAAARGVAAAAGAGSAAAALRLAQPSMPAFAALFARPEITALAWVHLVLLDLVQARWVWQDGRKYGIPVAHSAVLCFMVGPLGLLCHLITKAVLTWWRRRRGGSDGEFVTYHFS